MITSRRGAFAIRHIAMLLYPCLAGTAICQVPATGGDDVRANHVQTGEVELLARRHYNSYEKATFSFKHGVRDDPKRTITRNDWDLLFGDGNGFFFQVCTVVDDRGSIIDLGPMTFSEIEDLPLAREGCRYARATEGHLYLVHTLDSESNHFAVFRVIDLVPGKRCRMQWASFALDPPTAVNRLGLDFETRQRLADALDEVKEAADRAEAARKRKLEMRRPRVILEVRAGAGGGNPNRIDMSGKTSIYVDRKSGEPLDFDVPVTIHDDAVAYFEGGLIPAGKAFAITRIDYDGTCKGDSNGHGEFMLVVGNTVIEEMRDCSEPVSGSWRGWIEVPADAEASVYLEVANSSSGSVELSGRFVDASTD